MFVKDYMQKDPATICGESFLLEAVEYLHRRGVLTLPVMDGKKVIGVVTDRDVRKASPSSTHELHTFDMEYLLGKVRVSDIMTRMVVSVSPYATIEEATKLLHDRRIKGLPVVEEGELVGLITIKEILEFFSELFEKKEKAATIELKLNGETTNLARALEIITSHGANIVSAVTAPVERGSGLREVILHIEGEDVEGAKKDLMANNLVLKAA